MADVTAARHNNLQSRINLILGNGAGQSGYGQGSGTGYGSAVSSYQVSNEAESNLSIISAADINAIYADMLRVRVHQLGTQPTEIAELVTELNLIAETTSNFLDDNAVLTVDPDGSKKGIADFESLMSKIEADKFLAHSSQVTIESAILDSRSEVWNGAIYHEFSVTFNNADHRRHFFNTGGQILISSNITGAQILKGQDWAAFLNTIGTVSFNYNTTTGGLAIGNYQLTGTYQTVYLKSSQGVLNNVYQGNTFKIQAREVSSNKIQFKIELNDVSTGTIVDVNVDGRLETSVEFRRANSVYVSVPKPSINTDVSMSSFATPEPVYILSSSTPAVAEGNSVIINLRTLNVPNGSIVPYTITGVTSNDISGQSLTGAFVVNYDKASLTINVANDLILSKNDTEVLTLSLDNQSAVVSVNIIDSTPNPVYTLSSSTSSIYEGNTLTITLNTQNVVNGTQVPYTITGVTSDDINGQSLNGNFTVNNSTASIQLPITVDNFEESETLTLSVTNVDDTSTSISVSIRDAIYTLLSNNSGPTEGDSINITLNVQQLPNGTVVPYTITGVTSDDIDGAALTGSFVVNNNTASKTFKFTADAVVDPNEQFTLSLDNGKASITLTIADSPLPTSVNRTCISIIDESSVGGIDPSLAVMTSSWNTFRQNWPNRPFYLLQPNLLSNGTKQYSGTSTTVLRVPSEFTADSLAYGPTEVRRDNGSTSFTSDWYTICGLDQLPDGSKIALFIDTSGSMKLSTVQASYNLFKQKIQARNMEIIEVFNAQENWVLPFNTILD